LALKNAISCKNRQKTKAEIKQKTYNHLLMQKQKTTKKPFIFKVSLFYNISLQEYLQKTT